jgi:hypothetical protein
MEALFLSNLSYPWAVLPRFTSFLQNTISKTNETLTRHSFTNLKNLRIIPPVMPGVRLYPLFSASCKWRKALCKWRKASCKWRKASCKWCKASCKWRKGLCKICFWLRKRHVFTKHRKFFLIKTYIFYTYTLRNCKHMCVYASGLQSE